MWRVVTDVVWSLSVCLLVTAVRSAKTAEPIQMPFGMWTLCKELCISWSLESRQRKRHFLSVILGRADASQAVFEPPPENWRRPPGQQHTTWMKNIHDDLSSLDLWIHEARDLAQNRPLWRLMSLHSAMHS